MRAPNIVCAAACLLALGGCAATASPEWDRLFGDSARALTAQQLIEPGAPQRNAQTNPKTDGRTTRAAMDLHVETYRNPPPTNVISIGLGEGGSR
jgi:hypothetical protein